jgi:hypothetical protein
MGYPKQVQETKQETQWLLRSWLASITQSYFFLYSELIVEVGRD